MPRAKLRTPKGDASTVKTLLDLVTNSLDDGKAEDIAVIDLAGKSSIADYMVVATGRSSRQVSALAHQIVDKMKDTGRGKPAAEGMNQGDWVLLDLGDVIVHLFRPEVRAFYNLEKMWGAIAPVGAEGQPPGTEATSATGS